MSLLAALSALLQRWRALRDLRALEKRTMRDNPFGLRNLIFEAKELLDRDLRVRAKEVCQEACARFPDAALTSEDALNLLLRLELYNESDALLERAMKRHPNNPQVLEGSARVANRSGDHVEAVRRCGLLRKKFPGSLQGYWLGASSLSQLGRIDEAESVLEVGFRFAPNDVVMRIEYARLADRRKDWLEGLKRWTYVHDTLRHLGGTTGMASDLCNLGRYDEAEQLIKEVLYRAGNDVGVRIAYVRIAERREDWDEAVRRWTNFRNQFPLNPLGYIEAMKPLEKLGRVDEAEVFFREGVERIRDDARIMIEYARLAHQRGDWTNAAERWAALRERFPDVREAATKEAEAVAALRSVGAQTQR